MIGVDALYFLFAWLISAAAASWLSERKGYGERVGLTFGLILSALGLLIVLVLPGRPGSKWRVDGWRAAPTAQVALPDDPGDSPATGSACAAIIRSPGFSLCQFGPGDLLGSLRYRERQWAAADETDTASRLLWPTGDPGHLLPGFRSGQPQAGRHALAEHLSVRGGQAGRIAEDRKDAPALQSSFPDVSARKHTTGTTPSGWPLVLPGTTPM